jgi:hypothetical protein
MSRVLRRRDRARVGEAGLDGGHTHANETGKPNRHGHRTYHCQ